MQYSASSFTQNPATDLARGAVAFSIDSSSNPEKRMHVAKVAAIAAFILVSWGCKSPSSAETGQSSPSAEATTETSEIDEEPVAQEGDAEQPAEPGDAAPVMRPERCGDWAPKAPLPQKYVACETDANCEIVTTTCCPCSAGGSQVAVNSEFQACVKPPEGSCPEDQMCAQVYQCFEGQARCVDGTCQLAEAPGPSGE